MHYPAEGRNMVFFVFDLNLCQGIRSFYGKCMAIFAIYLQNQTVITMSHAKLNSHHLRPHHRWYLSTEILLSKHYLKTLQSVNKMTDNKPPDRGKTARRQTQSPHNWCCWIWIIHRWVGVLWWTPASSLAARGKRTLGSLSQPTSVRFDPLQFSRSALVAVQQTHPCLTSWKARLLFLTPSPFFQILLCVVSHVAI